MAYAFNSVMNLLNPEQQMPGESSGNVISSTETDTQQSGAGQSSAPAAGQPSAPQPQATAGARGRVMSRNVERAKAPTDMGRVSSNIGEARTNIQNEANAYMQSATQPYQMDQNQMQEMVKGYAAGTNQDLATRLRSAPERMQDIELSDTTVKDADLLKNDAGVREMVRRSQDAEGRMGEAALDTALLRRNQPFQLQRGDILNNYMQLQKEKAGIEDTARTNAQRERDLAAEQWKTGIKGIAESESNALEQMARERERLFDEQLLSGQQGSRAGIYDDAQAYADELAGKYASDPYLADAIRSSFGAGQLFGAETLDPNQFYTPGSMTADQTDYRQFYGEPEAMQFNRMMELLGGGETRQLGNLSNRQASEFSGGLNKDALTDAIMAMANPKAQASRQSAEKMAADKKAREDAAARAAAAPKPEMSDREKVIAMEGKGRDEMSEEEKAIDDQTRVNKRDPYWIRRVNSFLRGRG